MSRTRMSVALLSAATRAHRKARFTAPSIRGGGTLLTVASFNGPPQEKDSRPERSTPRVGSALAVNSRVAVELTSGLNQNQPRYNACVSPGVAREGDPDPCPGSTVIFHNQRESVKRPIEIAGG